MTTPSRTPARLDGVDHHTSTLNGTTLHHVSMGADGSPVLLVHGFPETWWAFHSLIPSLATAHRVHAVDLRGFGDSAVADAADGAATFAEDLHQLIAEIDEGPVHLLAQDLSGGLAYRLAARHPEDLLSFTAVEMGLPGFGAEAFGDAAHGGAWYIGALATPGVTSGLLTGRERALIADFVYPAYGLTGPGFDDDLEEFARTYTRPGGLEGAASLYRGLLFDGDELRELASVPLAMPVLAVGSSGGDFTANTMRALVGDATIETEIFDGVGHYVAQEAPDRLAEVLRGFWSGVDRGR